MEKKELNIKKEEPKKETKKVDEVKSNGLPKDVDLKKFMGCGG